MPHVNTSGGEDLASTDEIKVYKDEGEQEEQRTSEDISEVKLGLLNESERESEQGKTIGEHTYNGKAEDKNGSTSRIAGDEVNPFFYPYIHNGASTGKIPGLGPTFDTLQPPPAHAGFPGLPLLSLDKSGLHRPSLFSFTGASGQYPSIYPDLAASVQSWPGSAYPVTSVGMRSPYSGLLAAARGYSPLMNSPLSPGMSQPTLVSQTSKHDLHPAMLQENRFLGHSYGNAGNGHEEPPKEKKKPHIKKPLNAFMLFMKDMRAKVVAECTLKESAAINQILGRKWHALDRAEQAKYYEMAKKERELHLKLYPGWSARDNYAMHSKRKKRRRETNIENKECTNPKKCRARFGLDQQNQWCKPCRRKKKCIRFMTGDPNADEHSDKDDEEDDDDDDEMDNNDSMGTRVVESDTDDSSQAGYSSECGTSSSMNHDVPMSSGSSSVSRPFMGTNPITHTPSNIGSSSSQPASQTSDSSRPPHTSSLVAAS